MIYLIIALTLLSLGLANYMFLRRDKRKMHEEERRQERADRLMEMLKKKKDEEND